MTNSFVGSKQTTNRFFSLVVTLILATLLFTQTALGNDRVLRIGNSEEPTTLDPHRYFTNLEEHVLKDLFTGLTTMSAKGEVVPGVAERWATSNDGLVWTFTLREGLRWSDGTPLNSDDFVFAFRRLQDPNTAAPLAFFLYSIKNAAAVNSGDLPVEQLGVHSKDPRTLVIELERPFPFFAERLLYPTGYPVPQHAIQEFGEDWVKAENWVSNGPYALNKWHIQEYLEITKNHHFYDAENVAIARIRHYPIAEAASALNRYLADEVDIVRQYPRNAYRALLDDRPVEIRNSSLQSIMYLVFNLSNEKVSDVRIRRALALAIDRELLVERVLGMAEQPSSTMSPPILKGHRQPKDWGLFQPNEARRLLREVGFNEDNPLKLTLRYISTNDYKSVFVAIASMWREVGVDVSLHHSKLGTHFSELQVGKFEVAQAGWFGENNPEHYIQLLWSKIGPSNYGGYASASFDDLLEKAKDTSDLSSRLDLLYAAESVALRDYPVIPLYVVSTRNLVSTAIDGWMENGRNLHPIRFMNWK